jgi:RNA polymerase sigma-70 factor (ECF subfamily)
VVVDEIRRRSRRPVESLDEKLDAGDPQDPAPDAEAALRSARLGVAIRDCLRRLVTSRRRAVTLHLLGHSSREISELAALGVKSAENLVYRGLADLRSCLRVKGAHA